MKSKQRIAIAMSGGVDSSVAAVLMCNKYGKENVFGVTAKLYCYADKPVSDKACCSLESINDAKAVCEKLGIAHYVIDLSKEFEKSVIADFVSEYRLGHTPIPCIPCNKVIKFGFLLDKIKKLGADKLVTGHYVRLKKKGDVIHLFRGIDKTKDQSYFLYNLSQEQLKFSEFPLGEMEKSEVRSIAKKYGLKTAEKRESQGICFVVEGRVNDWLADKITSKPGEMTDMSGNEIGQHEGVIFYTLGQRKRIGGGFSEPMYVVKINAEANKIIVGTENDLYQKELRYRGPQWINKVDLPLKCTAKIRYNMEDEPCVINKNEKVIFLKPQRAITPGQSIVFYQKNIVLGGAIISN
jgi:tRNA-specific 2-thiouridylase